MTEKAKAMAEAVKSMAAAQAAMGSLMRTAHARTTVSTALSIELIRALRAAGAIDGALVRDVVEKTERRVSQRRIAEDIREIALREMHAVSEDLGRP